MTKHLLFIILCIGLNSTINAQTRYVSSNGSDALNDCTLPGNPCFSIAYCVTQAIDNDTIYVASGNYAYTSTQLIDKSVKVIGQDSLNKPVITATAPIIIEVTGDSVTISNLRIEMGLTMSDGVGGIVASGNYDGLVIDQNEIISTKIFSVGMVFNAYGIQVSGGVGQVITISNNVIEPLDTMHDAHGRGIGIGLNGTPGPGANIFGNSVSAYYPIQSIENTADVNCYDNFFTGYVLMAYPTAGTNLSFTSNTFDGYNDQVAANLTALLELRAFNDNTSALVQGNEFIHYKNIGLFSSASRNITVIENEFSPSDSATNFISIYANTKLFTAGTQITNYSNQIDIRGNIFNAGFDSMGTAIAFGDHYGVTSPAFEDTIKVGGPNFTDKNIFDTNHKYYIVLDSLSGPSDSVSFWSGYSVSNMVPFTQSVYALAAYNEYNITDTLALEEKMLDSLEVLGLGKVILFDTLVVTSIKNNELISLHLFPNPCNDFVSIYNKNLSGIAQVTIFDISGKAVFNSQANLSTNSLVLPINYLVQGEYIVMVRNNNKYYRSKFLKN
ncbi:MAG TPA: T9SS type A sorting domain-containing protein [Bacteroidia bacterium]|nr:T9SS type A sorting domain-containing protein [Bacteroidia bacterium]